MALGGHIRMGTQPNRKNWMRYIRCSVANEQPNAKVAFCRELDTYILLGCVAFWTLGGFGVRWAILGGPITKPSNSDDATRGDC